MAIYGAQETQKLLPSHGLLLLFLGMDGFGA
jgi:hypothetical protein